MIIKLKWLGWFITITIILVSLNSLFTNAYAQEAAKFLEWSIEPSKQAFYPGEPVLLTLNIKNTGSQEEEVNFGADGIEAFLMEIRDSNNIIVAKGGKIQRFGFTTGNPFLMVTPGGIGQKLIVLNRWCSTLLSPGQYKVNCNIEYRLSSEDKKRPDTIVIKAGPLHKMQLALDIKIIEMDKQELKKTIEGLADFEVKPEKQSKKDWLAERNIAREMLTFTESELAVPYQLQLLRVEKYTWRKRDIINSLVKSETLEAASGLVQIIEDPSVYNEDVKHNLIDGVYRLRENGNAEIINATEEFVAKYKRPIRMEPMD